MNIVLNYLDRQEDAPRLSSHEKVEAWTVWSSQTDEVRPYLLQKLSNRVLLLRKSNSMEFVHIIDEMTKF